MRLSHDKWTINDKLAAVSHLEGCAHTQRSCTVGYNWLSYCIGRAMCSTRQVTMMILSKKLTMDDFWMTIILGYYSIAMSCVQA